MKDMIGRVLGNRYEIIEKVGEGGMARVFRGIDHRLNRKVAIKILYEQFVHDPEFLRRFKQEAKSSAILSHPAIVNVYDEGEEEGIHYIVMEYVQGITLKSYILRNSGLKPEESVRLVLQICDALIHAHNENVVHRDIKPQNIILTPDGRVKVTDFGIARAAVDATITHGRSLMGSVHYSSPEQARGSCADHQSDIYSLGVVLYELLTGNVPFSGESPISIALKHLQEDIVPPGEVNPELPPELDRIVIKALHKERNQRYASAAELQGDLERWLETSGEPDYPGRKSRYLYTPLDKNLQDIAEDEEPDDEEQDDGMTRGFKRYLKKVIFVCVILSVLILLILGGYKLLRDLLDVPEVKVPNLYGSSVAEAERVLAELELGYEIKAEIYDEEMSAGLILAQDPPAERSVRKARVVELTVSLGQNLAELPSLIGRSELEARLILEEMGLEMEISSEYDEEAASGYVIRQDPSEGFQLSRGGIVYIVLSNGKKPFALRDFHNRTLEDAQEWLSQYDLILRNSEQEYSDLAEGRVISQFPEAGELVQSGDSVDLVISLGPEQSVATVYHIEVNPPTPIGDVIRVYLEDEEGGRVAYEGMYLGGPINVDGIGSGYVLLMERRDDNNYYTIERKYFP